jgi:hypothetical protein
MLRKAWNDYRGWAKLARDMQARTTWWNRAALCFVIAAAIFGAAASVAPQSWSALVAGVAALASALGAYFGKQIVGTGDEAAWIQTRAVAEGIKSECYRYAARSGPYAVPGSDAEKSARRPDGGDHQTGDRQESCCRGRSCSYLGHRPRRQARAA